MQTHTLLHRLVPVSVILGSTFFVASGIASAQSFNLSCLQQAGQQRTNQLRSAYNSYANEMGQSSDTLQQNEYNALASGDQNYRQTGAYNAYNAFNYDVTKKWNDLMARVTDAWNTYRQAIASCNAYGTFQSTQYNYPSTNYQYNSSVYNTNFPYNNYPYNNTNYQYNGTRYYPYDYNSNSSRTSVRPVTVSTSTRYPAVTYSQKYSYTNGTSSSCPALNLGAPPSGCRYQCNVGSNGCSTCQTVCSNAVSNPSCDCPPLQNEVCGSNGKTYLNACYATCAGTKISFRGACSWTN